MYKQGFSVLRTNKLKLQELSTGVLDVICLKHKQQCFIGIR